MYVMTSTYALRALFLTILVGVLIQIPLREVASEPYPGLYQPSFGASPQGSDVATALEPAVTVTMAGGARHVVPFRALLPETEVSEMAVFRSAFHAQEDSPDQATVMWLRSRVLPRYRAATR